MAKGKKGSKKQAKIEEIDDSVFDGDETLYERLVGLTEMIPEGPRTFLANSYEVLSAGAKKAYSVSGSAAWILSTSAVVLLVPLIFEVEKEQQLIMWEQEQKQIMNQQRQVLNPQQPAKK
eukprot:Clim_evm79s218 gene=Clim_evmTU79s218